MFCVTLHINSLRWDPYFFFIVSTRNFLWLLEPLAPAHSHIHDSKTPACRCGYSCVGVWCLSATMCLWRSREWPQVLVLTLYLFQIRSLCFLTGYTPHYLAHSSQGSSVPTSYRAVGTLGLQMIAAVPGCAWVLGNWTLVCQVLYPWAIECDLNESCWGDGILHVTHGNDVCTLLMTFWCYCC